MPKSLEVQLQEVKNQLEAKPEDENLIASQIELEGKIATKEVKQKTKDPKDISILKQSKDYAYFKEAKPTITNPLTGKAIGRVSEPVQVSVNINDVDTYLNYAPKDKIVQCIAHPSGDGMVEEINKQLN